MLKKKIRFVCGILIAFSLIFTYFYSEKSEKGMGFPSTRKITNLLDTSRNDKLLNGDYSNSTIFLYSTSNQSIILMYDVNNEFHAIKLDGTYTNLLRVKNGGNEYIIYNENNTDNSLKLTRYNDKIILEDYNKDITKKVLVTFQEKDNLYICNKKIDEFYSYQFIFDNKEYFSLQGKEKYNVYLLRDIDHLGL